MRFLSHKTKHFLILLLKIAIVSGAFYFIYAQLSQSEALDSSILRQTLCQPTNYLWLLLLVVLTFANRFIEILKWQNLASLLQPISIAASAKQVLSALTLGVFTPNGIGEYAGKALYFDKKQTGNVIFLNMVCNGVQVLYALFFGLLGLVVLNLIYRLIPGYTIALLFAAIVLILGLLVSVRHLSFKGYSLQTLIAKLRSIPSKTHRKNLLLALGRYGVFTHQYVILYYLFGAELPYFELLCAISCVYLLASSLPNFQFLEFAVKGSIALYIFAALGVDEWTVALVATLIWLLNIVLPVGIGSVFVLLYKTRNN